MGIDLAIYALKKTDKYRFTKNDFFKLLGIKKFNLERIGMYESPKGTYSRIHYVFPTYDLVTKKAKELLKRK